MLIWLLVVLLLMMLLLVVLAPVLSAPTVVTAFAQVTESTLGEQVRGRGEVLVATSLLTTLLVALSLLLVLVTAVSATLLVALLL